MGRTACAFVPRFELALRARAEPAVWDRCLAVVDWASAPPRLSCVTPAAEAVGIRVGQIASRSRARWPELVCLAPDAQLLAQAEREVLTALSSLSPRLDADGRGAFFLGLEGLERLWPSEVELLERLAALLTGLRLSARLAVAESPFVAWVGAQHLPRSGFIDEAMGEALLDRLPLAELDLSEPARELCVLLGLRSAGGLRRLPKGALAERLGKEGARLERLCRGETFPLWPTVQKMPRATEVVELDLELALEGLEPLLLALRSLLERLLAAVAAERKALVELTVKVRLDDRSQVVERFVPERPTLQSRGLLDLLHLWLERRPFADRVAGLRLEASRVAAADQSQLSLLRQREEQAAAALDQAIARLSAAFGASAVLFPRLNDTYRPEARLCWVNAQRSSGGDGRATKGERRVRGPELAAAFTGAPLTLALRQVDPPEPVALREAAFLTRSGQPVVRILRSDGPQKLSGEWWAQGFERSYYWLLLETGEIAWVFRDDLTGAYFLQALAD
jgi:protein ImuB